MDLAIAATANVHGVVLLTEHTGDFEIIADLLVAPRRRRSVLRLIAE